MSQFAMINSQGIHMSAIINIDGRGEKERGKGNGGAAEQIMRCYLPTVQTA